MHKKLLIGDLLFNYHLHSLLDICEGHNRAICPNYDHSFTKDIMCIAFGVTIIMYEYKRVLYLLYSSIFCDVYNQFFLAGACFQKNFGFFASRIFHELFGC
jgi:hypothetical protein